MESSMKVLVVEDEPLMSGFIARGLRANSYRVDVAPDGAQAIALVDTDHYDLVILDVRLPVKDGLPKLKDFPAEIGGSGETLLE